MHKHARAHTDMKIRSGNPSRIFQYPSHARRTSAVPRGEVFESRPSESRPSEPRSSESRPSESRPSESRRSESAQVSGGWSACVCMHARACVRAIKSCAEVIYTYILRIIYIYIYIMCGGGAQGAGEEPEEGDEEREGLGWALPHTIRGFLARCFK